MILLYGESASGKDTFVKSAGLNQVVSHTTRPRRVGEADGVDKHFDVLANYLLAKEDDSVIAETNIQGNQYWVTTADLQDKDVFIVDPAGILYLMDRYGGSFINEFSVLYLNVPWFVRLKRIIGRDGFKAGIKRFWSDRVTFSGAKKRAIKRQLKKMTMQHWEIRNNNLR